MTGSSPARGPSGARSASPPASRGASPPSSARSSALPDDRAASGIVEAAADHDARATLVDHAHVDDLALVAGGALQDPAPRRGHSFDPGAGALAGLMPRCLAGEPDPAGAGTGKVPRGDVRDRGAGWRPVHRGRGPAGRGGRDRTAARCTEKCESRGESRGRSHGFLLEEALSFPQAAESMPGPDEVYRCEIA